MKYYSEILKTFYDTAADCEGAEKEQLAKIKAAEEAEVKKQKERSTRAKEVGAAILEVREVVAKRDKLLEDFVKDYGSFHMTFDSKDAKKAQKSDVFDIFSLFH